MGGTSQPQAVNKTVVQQPWAGITPYAQGALQNAANIFGGPSQIPNMPNNGMIPYSGSSADNNQWLGALGGSALPSAISALGMSTAQAANQPGGKSASVPMQSGTVNPAIAKAMEGLFNFSNQDFKNSDAFNRASQYLTSQLDNPYQGTSYQDVAPVDVGLDQYYNAAKKEIIPEVESRFSRAGALNSGAARMAEAGALSDAFAKNKLAENQLRLQQRGQTIQERLGSRGQTINERLSSRGQNMSAAGELGRLGQNETDQRFKQSLAQISALMQAVQVGQIPREEALRYLQTIMPGISGAGTSNMSGTEMPAQGTDPLQGGLGLLMLLSKM